MHEWSLAYAVISSSIEYCLKQGKKQATAIIELGELQQIDKEIFRDALKENIPRRTERNFFRANRMHSILRN